METTNFIESVKKISHYQNIKFPDKNFLGWNKDYKITDEYARFIFSSSNCASLKLDINIPYEEMFQEAFNNFHRLVEHRGSDNIGWSSMCIHGTTTEETNTWTTPSYGYKEEPIYNWTDLADSCPVTKNWLKSFPCKSYQRVRFMILQPGGIIHVHKDKNYRKLSAINVALNNPIGCHFFMEDAGEIPWEPGDVRLIDNGRLHAIVNNSQTPRVHMIIHGDWSFDISKLACSAFDKLI